ncbi:MAG: MFS transporter [Ignavibacteria bacterium]|jgi:MFS family permease|nr:MFS transporter [Ignavibacteria bacterium]MDH7528955.1 MFS transporter [Ignavibacteria bacterium]
MNNWKSNLYIIWLGQFIAMLGMSMVVPFLPLYIRELGLTDNQEIAKWSGFVFSGPFLFSFLLVPLWGFLGDKYGRKLMVIRALFGLAIAQIFIGFSQNVYHLLIGRLIQGMVSGFVPAAMALVASTTPKEKTGYALGLLQTATSGGTVLGPFVGGLLADHIGIRPIFFITASLCFLSALLVIIKVKEDRSKTTSSDGSLKDNYIFVFRSSQLRLIILMIVFVQISIAFNQPLFALYAETLHIDKRFIASIAGLLYGIMGVFTMIGSPFWGKYNEKHLVNKSFAIASFAAAFSYSLHYFIYNPFLLGFVRSILGIALGGLLPVLYTLVSLNSPIQRRGGIMGIASSAQVLGNLLGPTLSGMIASQIGIRPVFLVSAFILFCVGAVGNRKIVVD